MKNYVKESKHVQFETALSSNKIKTESTAGYHSLNGVEEKQFAFDIPENCPSSFQSYCFFFA